MSTMTETVTPSSTALVLPPETAADLGRQGEAFAAHVALQIVDDASFQAGAELVRDLAGYIERVNGLMNPICQATHEAHKIAVAQRDSLRKPAEDLKKTLGQRLADYETEQARLREIAEEAARKERERLQREEDERAAIELQQLQRQAEDVTLERAVQAEAAGDRQLAEQLVAAPPVVAAPTPRPVFVAPTAPPAPRAAGLSFKDNWSARVDDFMALVKAVAAGHQPIALLEPNLTALNGMARSLKSAMAIPGVRAVNERVAATRKA